MVVTADYAQATGCCFWAMLGDPSALANVLHGASPFSVPPAPHLPLLALPSPLRCVWRSFYAVYLDIYSFGKLSANAHSREQDMQHFADSLRGAMLLSLACCAALQVGRGGTGLTEPCCMPGLRRAGWVTGIVKRSERGTQKAPNSREPSQTGCIVCPPFGPALPAALPEFLPAAAGRSCRGGAARTHGFLPARAGICNRQRTQLACRHEQVKTGTALLPEVCCLNPVPNYFPRFPQFNCTSSLVFHLAPCVPSTTQFTVSPPCLWSCLAVLLTYMQQQIPWRQPGRGECLGQRDEEGGRNGHEAGSVRQVCGGKQEAEIPVKCAPRKQQNGGSQRSM